MSQSPLQIGDGLIEVQIAFLIQPGLALLLRLAGPATIQVELVAVTPKMRFEVLQRPATAAAFVFLRHRGLLLLRLFITPVSFAVSAPAETRLGLANACAEDTLHGRSCSEWTTLGHKAGTIRQGHFRFSQK